MKAKRILHGAIVAASIGCSGPVPETVVLAPIASEAEAPRAALPQEVLHAGSDQVPDPCRDLREEQLAPIEAAFRPGPVASTDPLDESAARSALARLGGSCWPSKRGAWALQIEWVSPRPWTGYTGLRARFALVHVGTDGRHASVRPGAENPASNGKEPSNVYFSALDASGVEPPSLFDFDGDGEDEIVLSLAGAHEGENGSEATVWHASGDKVAPYAPANGLRFERAKDVDGDGRPDLIGFGVYQAVLGGCCNGFGHSVLGPTLVYHSLRDGSFSQNDAVAVDAARFPCPSASDPIILPGSPWDESAVLEGVACARLWGRSAKDIDAELLAATPPGPDTCDHVTCADRSEVTAIARKWAAASPPLSLK